MRLLTVIVIAILLIDCTSVESSEVKENRVHNIATKQFVNETGQFDAIVIGFDIYDPTSLEDFVVEVVDLFKKQRMISPPDIANMTITIKGECTAQEFADLWNRIRENDEILKFFMDKMVLADVLRFDKNGITDRTSILANEKSVE